MTDNNQQVARCLNRTSSLISPIENHPYNDEKNTTLSLMPLVDILYLNHVKVRSFSFKSLLFNRIYLSHGLFSPPTKHTVLHANPLCWRRKC